MREVEQYRTDTRSFKYNGDPDFEQIKEQFGDVELYDSGDDSSADEKEEGKDNGDNDDVEYTYRDTFRETGESTTGERVETVETDAGETITYTYDAERNPVEILQTNADGSSSTTLRKDGEGWVVVRTEDGISAEPEEAKNVTLREDGGYSYTTSDAQYTKRADGSLIVEGADGQVRNYQFDASGELERLEIHSATGGNDGRILYTRNDEGGWTQLDPVSGEVIGTYEKITPNPDGGFTVEGDNRSATYHPDGAMEETRDHEGLKVTHEYGTDGQLDAITTDGAGAQETLTRNSDGTWEVARADGLTVTDVIVDDDGSFTYKYGTDGNASNAVIQNADGSRVESLIGEDGALAPLTVRHPDGSIRYFEYDGGKLVQVTQTWPESFNRRPEIWKQIEGGMFQRNADGMVAWEMSVDEKGNFSFVYPTADGQSRLRHTDAPSGKYMDVSGSGGDYAGTEDEETRQEAA